MKSDEVSVRYTIFGGIAGRASVKPGNPRLSDVRWMLDLRFAMVDAHMFARLIGGLSVRQPDSQTARQPASQPAT